MLKEKSLFFLLLLFSCTQLFADDTLKPASFADTCAKKIIPGVGVVAHLVTYKTPFGGFIGGNNYLHTPQKAQKYYLNDTIPATLKAIAFWFGEKKSGTVPGFIKGNVYNVNRNTGGPLDLLGESQLASFSNIDTANNFTIVTFPQPIQLPDTFFVSLDMTQFGVSDSAGLLSTQDSCYSGEQLAWEQDSAGLWHPFNDGTIITSWGLNIDLAIFPIGNFGLPSATKDQNIFPLSISPVPAKDKLKLNFFSGRSEPIVLIIFDATGKKVYEWQLNSIAGMNKEILNITSLNNGIYFLKSYSGGFSFSKKFVVTN